MPALLGLTLNEGTIFFIMIFAIPIVAIIGGITAGIVKTMTEARIVENAQRERIAAIQAGFDPARLPPPPVAGSASALLAVSPAAAARHRSQGLLVGGIVTMAVGFGVVVLLLLLVDDREVWAAGLIPVFIGIALLLSAWIVRPRQDDVEAERRAGTHAPGPRP